MILFVHDGINSVGDYSSLRVGAVVVVVTTTKGLVAAEAAVEREVGARKTDGWRGMMQL